MISGKASVTKAVTEGGPKLRQQETAEKTNNWNGIGYCRHELWAQNQAYVQQQYYMQYYAAQQLQQQQQQYYMQPQPIPQHEMPQQTQSNFAGPVPIEKKEEPVKEKN